MSYILDALKKADAQRERDPARGIHARPAALPTLQQPWIGRRPWFRVTAALALAALAAAGWFVWRDAADERPAMATSDARVPRSAEAPALAPAPTGTGAPGPAPVADAVLPPPAPVAPTVVAASQPGAATTRAENAARLAPAAKAPPASGTPASAVAAAAPPAAPPAAVAAAPVATAAAARPIAPPPATAPAAPVAAGAAPIGNGLPADAPKLAISGGVYSSNRAQRMLIVDGQVVNEGADLGGGVVLEEIRPKAAVLRFRGGRYNVGF